MPVKWSSILPWYSHTGIQVSFFRGPFKKRMSLDKTSTLGSFIPLSAACLCWLQKWWSGWVSTLGMFTLSSQKLLKWVQQQGKHHKVIWKWLLSQIFLGKSALGFLFHQPFSNNEHCFSCKNSRAKLPVKRGGDPRSKARLRYVKHSMSSMCTWKNAM